MLLQQRVLNLTVCYVNAGEVSEIAKHVSKVTEMTRDAAIAICAPGVDVKEIGAICQEVAQKNNCMIVKDFVGHGVGKIFHAGPHVHHHRNRFPGKMVENMTLTIEPIVCAG